MRRRVLALITSICVLVSICAGGLEGAAVFGAEKKAETISGDFAKDQIVVVFDEDINEKKAETIIDEKAGEDLTVLDTPQKEITAVVELPKEQTVEEAVEIYEKDSHVAYAQPNYRYKLIDGKTSGSENFATTKSLNDRLAKEQWYLDTIQAEEAWNLVAKSNHSKTKVAVLDTGVDTDHPDLQKNLNKNLCKDSTDGQIKPLSGDDDGHGTHVCGIIAATADNQLGVAGVASGKDNSSVELFAVDVFKGEYAYTDAIIAGLQYALDEGAKVINISAGYESPWGKDAQDLALEAVINKVVSRGTTVVCASGNENNTVTNYPADFNACISVISTNRQNKKSDFSNYGAAKDISAPGGQQNPAQWIVNTYPGDRYAGMVGTSMASPVVSGVAALLYSLKPNLTVNEVKQTLYHSAVDIYSSGWDASSGYGVVNAFRAVGTLNRAAIKVSLNRNSLTLHRGSSYKLTASVLPNNAVNKKIVWSSSNASVAAVDSTGRIRAVGSGTAVVTAKINNEFKPSATCKITVPYTITYKLNGGKNATSNPASYYGRKVSLKNPSRKGYTFSGWYRDNKYKHKVTSFSSGNFTLYAKWKKVKVSKASIKKTKRVSKTKLKVYYKKVSGAKGYQITYSTSKKFTKKKSKSVTAKGTNKTLSKLKKGSTYYVKVRAFKKDSAGAKVYGRYSKVKKIKLKK